MCTSPNRPGRNDDERDGSFPSRSICNQETTLTCCPKLGKDVASKTVGSHDDDIIRRAIGAAAGMHMSPPVSKERCE
jgi:hypothetical protein